jgi:hypothetical protein
MGMRRFKPEQIVTVLRQIEVGIGEHARKPPPSLFRTAAPVDTHDD